MDKTTWQQDINRTNLVIARENVGLSTLEATRRIIPPKSGSGETDQDQLLDVDRTPEAVDRVQLWESGQTSPTYKQLEKLAKLYNVNIFQLLIPDQLPTTKPPATFRSDPSRPTSYNLSRFISILRVRQAILGRNLRRDGVDQHRLVGTGRNHKDPEQLADLIRQEIDYDIDKKSAGQDALKYLRTRLHDNFIFVFKTMSTACDLIEVKEMRGLYLHDDYAPCIALNRRDHRGSQLFSLAHELAHLFRAEERVDSIEFRDMYRVDDSEESFCNLVAASLLVPRDRIPVKNAWGLAEIKALAESNHVSSLVALYRLDHVGQLDRPTTNRYSQQLAREFADHQTAKTSSPDNQTSGGSYYNNMRDSNGQLFGEFVFSLHLDGRLSAVEAQNLLKLPVTEI